MTTIKLAHKNMLRSQLETNKINDEVILAALAEVPREDFVPTIHKRTAYTDEDIDLGNGRFLLEPLSFAKILAAANIKQTDIVLDIACASGYSSVVLAKLARKVFAIDSLTKTMNVAKSNFAKYEAENISCSKQSLLAGNKKDAPYDVIIIAGEIEELPNEILMQLKQGGKLVTIISGYVTVIERHEKIFSESKIVQANAPQIAEFKKPRGFIF